MYFIMQTICIQIGVHSIFYHNYCKSGNFRENFILAYSIKRHICDAKNLRLGHDLHISVKGQSDFGLSRGFYFHETSHMRSFAKIKPLQKFPNLQ